MVNVEDEISREGCTRTYAEISADDVTVEGTRTSGCVARHQRKIFAGAKVDLFISVTELADALFPSTKRGESITSGGLFSMQDRMKMSVLLWWRQNELLTCDVKTNCFITQPSI
jgi:hypothetical protein